MKVLLDTHVLLWWVGAPERLGERQRSVLARASDESPVLVSDITLWEVAMLAALGRIRLEMPLRSWLEAATAPPLVQRVGMTPAIAAETVELPESFHRDPADRILVATARVLNATLVTRDRRILESNLVATV